MNITFHLSLAAPSGHQMYGGANLAVFRRVVTVPLTPELLSDLLRGRATVDGAYFRVDSEWFKPEDCSTSGHGMMENATAEHMDSLQAAGWALDEKAAQHHHLPQPTPADQSAPASP